MQRNRFVYFILFFTVILLGLASRSYASILPEWVHLYAGDALWALMVYFLIGFILTQKSPLWIAILALAFSFGLEISQLYHAPWIEAIRANRLGGLILGFGFLWSDLVCYGIGILFGYSIEVFLSRKDRNLKTFHKW
jgi:hypothetical protein